MMNQHLYKPLHTPYNNMKIYHFGLSEFCPKKGKYSKVSIYLFSPRGIKIKYLIIQDFECIEKHFLFFLSKCYCSLTKLLRAAID